MKSKKQQLRSKADKLWYQVCLKDKCEVCGKEATQVHHFFPKSIAAHLRYTIENGISLCMGCHFKHHTQGNPVITQTIIKNRGERWYNALESQSRDNPASYQTISYYFSKINELTKKL